MNTLSIFGALILAASVWGCEQKGEVIPPQSAKAEPEKPVMTFRSDGVTYRLQLDLSVEERPSEFGPSYALLSKAEIQKLNTETGDYVALESLSTKKVIDGTLTVEAVRDNKLAVIEGHGADLGGTTGLRDLYLKSALKVRPNDPNALHPSPLEVSISASAAVMDRSKLDPERVAEISTVRKLLFAITNDGRVSVSGAPPATKAANRVGNGD